ncbi:MAG TPA: hypothetical protein VF809_00020 [Candidatus Saccharimonadales bacterium]
MEFGNDYNDRGDTGEPTPPDGYAEDIDIGTMTADTAEPETPETTASRMAQEVLARSGLEQPDYGSVIPASETEPPEPVSEPVAVVTERNEQSGAELKPVEIITIGGARCAASGITSGIVYLDYDRITPEIVQENLKYVERLRAEFREQGERPSDHEQELIATAQEALLKYAETLGIDFYENQGKTLEPAADRMPPLEQYRFFDRKGDFLSTTSSAERAIARARPGVGVGIDRSSLSEDPVDQLHLIAHETAHMTHRVAVHSRMDEVGYRLTWAPCAVQDQSGEQRTGFYEAITNLHTHRALDGGYYQRLGDRYPRSGNGIDAILSGIITKYAAENDADPNAIADEIVKGALTGDLSAMERLVEPFGDRQCLIVGLRVDEQPRRLVEIARTLGLQGTWDILAKWANNESLWLRGAYDW